MLNYHSHYTNFEHTFETISNHLLQKAINKIAYWQSSGGHTRSGSGGTFHCQYGKGGIGIGTEFFGLSSGGGAGGGGGGGGVP